MSSDAVIAKRVDEHTFEVGHYLLGMARKGLLKREFPVELGAVAFDAACYTQAQAIGNPSARLFGFVPGTVVNTIEVCSGHDGAWGVRKQSYNRSLKVGAKLFGNFKRAAPNLWATDCPLAALQIQHGAGQKPIHSIQALAVAYGLRTS